MIATASSSETSLTSFVQLFGLTVSGLGIDRIEIPIIQRDYAQGRQGEVVERIRANFLDALCDAVKPDGKAIGLDFVYGDVEKDGLKKGTFYPLDGQQRLTTLFLLHWYLAWLANVDIHNQPWTKFTYATRPGARLFCKRLTEFQPSAGEIVGDKEISAWLTDQAWYLHTWQHDPTIQSMLVMLDAFQQCFHNWSDEDCKAAWQRLTDAQNPAISFHLLPMAAIGLTDDLYIKMNSRGKPLTAFENFKANFEVLLKNTHPEKKVDEFAKKVDTEWADTLWPYRGDDHLIDDEFMRYFRFVTEVCAWQSGVSVSDKPRIDDLAGKIYGATNAKAADNLEFLLQAFDVWYKIDIKDEFDRLFTATHGGGITPLLVFNAFKNPPQGKSPVDLFGACCRHYAETKSDWTLAHTLLLYAVLLDRIYDQRESSPSFPKQLRSLRNLIDASGGGEIRDQNMPELLADVKRVVVDGTLQGVARFNQAQIVNENDKAAFLEQHEMLQTTLYRLEDHTLLRGCLAAFDLDPTINSRVVTQRVDAFHALFDNPDCWPELTGALLAIGDYSRQEARWTGYHFSDFGASKSETPWRELFKGKKEESSHPAANAMTSLLDQVAAVSNDLNYLKTIQQDFWRGCEKEKRMDWRYYCVKYPAMREGASGRYAMSSSGYSVCMLEYLVMRGKYRDPYLLAIWHAGGVGEEAADPWPWFYGYETDPRRMRLKTSGIQIQCVEQGWQITEAPIAPTQKIAFDQVCSKHGIDQSGLFAVSQNNGVDTCDRVALGAQLLSDLVKAGL